MQAAIVGCGGRTVGRSAVNVWLGSAAWLAAAVCARGQSHSGQVGAFHDPQTSDGDNGRGTVALDPSGALSASEAGQEVGGDCGLRCQAQAQVVFDECWSLHEVGSCAGVVSPGINCDGLGLTVLECGAIARLALAECALGQCGAHVARPGCEFICGVEAEWTFHECFRAGGSSADCGLIGRESERRCLGERCGIGPGCEGECVRIRLPDEFRDVAVRRTDPGLNLPVDMHAHPAIDLLEIQLGTWLPAEPAADLFRGEFDGAGAFARLDMVLGGLVNPPGPAVPTRFDPFVHGARPVYGFVEIDMDDNVRTGGEMESPDYRYLGNAARFGGLPSRPTFRNRAAGDDSAFDGRFASPPFVERHGEEFHIALTGTMPFGIVEQVGDGDAVFDPGETWVLTGRFLHRAHGFEWFSLADGGPVAGAYLPVCDLQFRHVPDEDLTYVSLVFPLTQVGAGLMRDEPAAPVNHTAVDQASILEGLADLHDSAAWLRLFPTGLAEEDIIIDWADEDPADYLDPTRWSVTALIGTTYLRPAPAKLLFVWTDMFPNVTVGDVDGDGFRSAHDAETIRRFVSMRDGVDGVFDEAVRLGDFAAGFNVLDVNYDGVVDETDAIIFPGDGDGDWDVDLCDYAVLQHCFSRGGRFPPCLAMDFDRNGTVDIDDFQVFRWLLSGSGGR